MRQFIVEHLTNRRLLDAWPVARSLVAHPNAEWWLGEALLLIDHGGGVLAARAMDGTVHGIATYRLVQRPKCGRTLSVESIVTFELSRKAPARQALCDALDALSLDFECKGIGIIAA